MKVPRNTAQNIVHMPQLQSSEILGSHSGDYEENCFLDLLRRVVW
jgi:hypothetical protein